jgi:uncharacterized membrane protein (DUF4010 family)
MVAGLSGGLLATLFLWLRSGRATTKREEPVALSNPFELGAALKFALLFAVILVGSKGATIVFGTAGTYVAGLLAGSTDVDAITLSVAKLAGDGGLSADVAATTIFLGAASNTLAKGALGAVVGGWVFGRRVLGAQLAVLAAGAVGAALARM